MNRNEQFAYSKALDAGALEDAARVIRRRSKKPTGIVTTAFCRVLTDTAAELLQEADELYAAARRQA